MCDLETGKITPYFNGNLAQELIWNQEVLDGFSMSVQLWTDIVIKDSNQTGGASTLNLGEILAWRRFANPKDLFRRTIDKDKIVEVSDKEPAEVIINHLILTEQINRGGQRFDKEKYVQGLNSSVAKGLLNIAAKEKLISIAGSLAIDGLIILPTGLFGGIAYLTFDGHLTNWVNSWMHMDTIDYISSRILESIIGLGATTSELRYLRSCVQLDQNYLREGWSHGDLYNPFKHIKNLLKGNFYMAKNYQNLVTLNE